MTLSDKSVLQLVKLTLSEHNSLHSHLYNQSKCAAAQNKLKIHKAHRLRAFFALAKVTSRFYAAAFFSLSLSHFNSHSLARSDTQQ